VDYLIGEDNAIQNLTSFYISILFCSHQETHKRFRGRLSENFGNNFVNEITWLNGTLRRMNLDFFGMRVRKVEFKEGRIPRYSLWFREKSANIQFNNRPTMMEEISGKVIKYGRFSMGKDHNGIFYFYFI
jgi:hypothetical protein